MIGYDNYRKTNNNAPLTKPRGALCYCKGYNLLELIIALTIVAILAAIAIAAFGTYLKKAKISEIVYFGDGLKVAINTCYQDHGDMSLCTQGSSVLGTVTIPTDSKILSVDITSGVITVTSQVTDAGGTNYTYTLTPTIAPGISKLTWAASGTVCTDSLINCAP